MKRLLIILFPCFLVSCLYGIFDSSQSFSARALSLGGAYAALSDDATGINTNPAGISQIKDVEVCGVYSPLYSDECYYELLAVVLPYGYNTFGISFIRNAIRGTYSEDSYSLAYSRILKRNVFFGFNLKVLSISSPGYEKYEDPAYSGGKMAMAYDIGYMHKIFQWLSAGLKLENANSPEIKLLSTSSGEKLKTQIKSGIAFKPKNAILSIEYNPGSSICLGSEITFAKFFSIRAGVNEKRVTSGFGISYKKIKTDFGFLFHKELGILYRTGISFNL